VKLTREQNQALVAFEKALKDWSSAHFKLYGQSPMFEFERRCILHHAAIMMVEDKAREQAERARRSAPASVTPMSIGRRAA
jgi:hypothetical protein